MWLKAHRMSASASNQFRAFDWITRRRETTFTEKVDEKGMRTFNANRLVLERAESILAQQLELPKCCCSWNSSLAAVMLMSSKYSS